MALLTLPANVLVGTTLASNIVSSSLTSFGSSPSFTTPLLGTPTSGTLTNCTGLPIATGVSGLGSGVATWLATPSSANLASALADKTGTGVNVFATAPSFPTSITIGAASGSTGTALFKGATSGTVTLTTADAAGTWTMKLPTSGGSASQFLQTDGAGVTIWATVSSGLTIGTTTITSGTSGRVLYDNAGVVGEMTTTGSGTVLALATSPSLTTPAIGAATGTSLVATQSINATSTDGFVLTNTTAAAAGAQQWSPRLRLTSQGWKTNATAASQTVDWIVENQPVQGAANPTTNLVFSSQVNAGGYTSLFTFASDGTLWSTTPTGSGSFYIRTGAGGNGSVYIGGHGGGYGVGLGNDTTMGAYVRTTGVTVTNTGAFSFASGSSAENSADLYVYRDAANTLALRNSTNAQTARFYNTYTDGSNNEHFNLAWSSNVLHLGAVKNGTGTARVIQIDYGGTTTAAISVPITSGTVTFGGGITLPGGATFLTTNTALTDGAAAQTATMTNSPTAGNPTKWIGINDNGTTRYIPAW